MKPIIFNTMMVQAILEGRKTQTRRVMKHPEGLADVFGHMNECKQPFMKGDILYVREKTYCTYYQAWDDQTYYAADYDDKPDWVARTVPSIHMPRDAARIFLLVTDVRVERLQDISPRDVKKEGIVAEKRGDEFDYEAPPEVMERFTFEEIWDSTIKLADRDRYDWEANPWVWVYTFERCEPEE